MRMTIEKSLEWLISRKEHYEMDDNCQELAQALDTAIDTMRKYQKIQKIIDNWKIYGDVNSYDCIADIYDVLESEG